MDGNWKWRDKIIYYGWKWGEKWIKGEFSKREDNIQLWFKVLILVIRFMKVYCTNKNDKNCTIN